MGQQHRLRLLHTQGSGMNGIARFGDEPVHRCLTQLQLHSRAHGRSEIHRAVRLAVDGVGGVRNPVVSEEQGVLDAERDQGAAADLGFRPGDPLRVDVHRAPVAELEHLAPRGLGHGCLLARRPIAVREGDADRSADRREGEMVLVRVAVRDLLELALRRVVRGRAADDRYARGRTRDASQQLLFRSHEGEGQQRPCGAAELLQDVLGSLLAGREGVVAHGHDRDRPRPIGDQHQAGRPAGAGDPAVVPEHAGGR